MSKMAKQSTTSSSHTNGFGKGRDTIARPAEESIDDAALEIKRGGTTGKEGRAVGGRGRGVEDPLRDEGDGDGGWRGPGTGTRWRDPLREALETLNRDRILVNRCG